MLNGENRQGSANVPAIFKVRDIMLKTTALHSRHRDLDAKLVPFAGWEMPLRYRSSLEEHRAVRNATGMFDVSHMCVVDLKGAKTTDLLKRILANDVGKLHHPGRALYTCMLNDRGGVIDDLIVYFLSSDQFRIVVNASTAEKDLAWLYEHAKTYGVEVCPRHDLGILAVQGPESRTKVSTNLDSDLARNTLDIEPFSCVLKNDLFVSRTGYTGEDGFELIAPHDQLIHLWDRLIIDGVQPCGLGARDTLRLEAALHLYGQDMDESVTPLECGLSWTVAWQPEDRHFIGRDALARLRGNSLRKFMAFVLRDRGVLRNHMPVRDKTKRLVGNITSGGYAPTMKASVALARVSVDAHPPFEVQIRDGWVIVDAVKPPFVRRNKILV